MTLASIRTQLWRGSGDVALVYRANGRRRISAHVNPFDDEYATETPGATA